MRLIILCFIFSSQFCFAKTKIYGSAINGHGQFVHVLTIDDYITSAETIMFSTSVDENDQFYIELEDAGIREVVIRINNSYAQLYIQNEATYFIEFPEESIDVIPYFSGNETEILFFKLDSTDINYKILGFEAWMDDELADLYILKDVEPTNFIQGILQFKADVQKEYMNDTSVFFKSYIKYSLGKIVDNIHYFGSPSNETKFDFFIKNEEIRYHNPAYMDFVSDFYDRYLYQMASYLRGTIIESIFEQNSRNMVKALSFDSLIPNVEFAELIALKIIQEEYKFGNLPKNNLISITSQIESNGLNFDNRKIAYNLIEEFYTIIEGDPLPQVQLREGTKLESPSNKYLYIHFFNPNNPTSLSEISALRRLYDKYKSSISFISLYLDQTSVLSPLADRVLNVINWDVYGLKYKHSLWKDLNIGAFPYYILVNSKQQIVRMPALGPNPNGIYQTIEKTFHDIQKSMNE
jgi:hypothetical protein